MCVALHGILTSTRHASIFMSDDEPEEILLEADFQSAQKWIVRAPG
jgi:hypothetical protein